MKLRAISVLLLLLCFCPRASALQRVFGYCTNGGVNPTLSGLPLSNSVMASYPGCTVTVFLAGTLTMPSGGLFSDNMGTALSDPFTANINTGYWEFYVANGRYDVRLSGSGIPNAFTLGDVLVADAASIPLSSDLIQYVSPNGNDNNNGFSSGTAKALVSTCLTSVPLGGTCIVTGGTIAQGSTPLVITGRSLQCMRGVVITFNGLGTTTDAVTIQGWSTKNYPLTVEGCTFVTSASGSASGQDIIQVSGGNHVVLKNLNLFDPGRDAIHVEPACSFCWIENLTLDNIQTNLCSASINGCSGAPAASGTLRDDLMFAMGEKFSASLTNIFINEVTINKGNLRAHARYGEHWYNNNSCSGCALQNYIFQDTHTDGAGRVPAATPDVYIEKGASGASNEINNIAFLSGDSEDTVTSRSGPVFKASGASLGQGVNISAGWGYFNFAALMDVNFPADMNNGVWFLYNSSHVQTTPVAFWKDGTPSAAGSVGLFCPGGSQTSSLTFCSYNGGWAPGGFAAGLATKSSGYTIQYSDSWVNVTGTTTITVPHALTGQRWHVQNTGTSFVTLSPDSGSLTGAGILGPGIGAEITCDGTNCQSSAQYPQEIAEVNLAAQQANISATTFYAVPANGAGIYRISGYLVETQAATTSSNLPNFFAEYTDNDTGVSETPIQIGIQSTANAVGTVATSVLGSGPFVASLVFNAKASTNIQYSTTAYASSGATPMQYAIHIRLEFLGP